MHAYDVIIVGTGVAGLFVALNLGEEKNILIITKSSMDLSDSFLAQGGIGVQLDDQDYDSFMQDTMRAGHYKNKREAVDLMIKSSREIINDLIQLNVAFDQDASGFSYTKEGAHSKSRILHLKDSTGYEISSTLMNKVKSKKNVTILEKTTLIDLLSKDNHCYGVVVKRANNVLENFYCHATVLATGGIGGLYKRSTNYPHLTGDALAIALKHKVKVKDLNYVQIHPTSLYTDKPGRAFLISESVRGEGAVLLDKNGNRFTDELQSRDIVTKAIYEQMEKDQMPYVRLCMAGYVQMSIAKRFPGIYKHCLLEGYDITKTCIPVVPAQHYLMGGIDVNLQSKTSMANLYAVGETSCNGVHGRNRLASNSFLESLVFSKVAAKDIMNNWNEVAFPPFLEPENFDHERFMAPYRHKVIATIRKETDHAK